MVFIRADGNEHIATGHIMRCLAIAKAIKKLGQDVTFIVAELFPIDIIENNGFSVICLQRDADNYSKESTQNICNLKNIYEDKRIQSKCNKDIFVKGESNIYDYNNLNNEINLMKIIIKKENITVLIVDSYFVTEKYLYELKCLTKVVYIDDLGEMIYPCHVLINYCNYYKKFNYNEKYKNISTKLYLGCDFVPLRDEFTSKISKINNRKIKEKVTGIMITTGGTDKFNLSAKICKNLINEFKKLNMNNIKIQLIVGKYNSNIEELKALENLNNNIQLLYNISNISNIMLENDIAISAGGTTLYELCFCKIPTICFAFADNQLDGTEEFGNSNTMINVGDVREDINKKVQSITEKIVELANNYKLREKLSQLEGKVVDGKGVNRIGKIIMGLIENNS